MTFATADGAASLTLDSGLNVIVAQGAKIQETDGNAYISFDSGYHITGSSAGDIVFDIDNNANETDSIFRITANNQATELVRVVESGNVGIGGDASTPLGKLHVASGDSTASSANASADELVVEGAGNTGINILSPDGYDANLYFGTNTDNLGGMVKWDYDANLFTIGTHKTGGILQFQTDNGSERMRIDSSGNVLVGTTTFNNLSTESGVLASNKVVMARGGLADHQDACAVLQYTSDATWLRAYGDTAGSGYIVFRTGGGAGSGDTERMRINSDGNVGIGTDSKENGYPAGFTTLAVAGNGTDKAGIIEISGNRGANGNQLGMIQFWNTNTSSTENARISGINTTTSVNGGQLTFHTKTDAGSLTERLRIDSSGNVGIGRTSIAQPSSGATTLAIQGTSTTKGGAIRLYSSDDSVAAYIYLDNTSGLSINTSTSHPMVFRTAGSEAMRIDSSGNVRIGTDTTNDIVNSNYSLHVKDAEGIASEATANGGACFMANKNASNTDGYYFVGYDSGFKFKVEMDGDVYNTNGTYGQISSDIRLKENIKDATSKLNDLNSLNVKNFNYIGNDKKQIGFIADEFQQVFPSLVTESDTRVYDDDGNVINGFEDAKGLKVGMEFAILVKAMQELSAQNDALVARIEALENA